jgi:hypothetical protein
MTQDNAHAIIEAASEELDFHDDYSGRGMFGRQTYAVSGDRDVIIKGMFGAGFDPDDFRWDQLGLGAIAY